MNFRRFFIGRAIGFFVLLIIVFVYFYFFKTDKNPDILNDYNNASTTVAENFNVDIKEPDTNSENTVEGKLVYPIDEFNSRITKKPFGIYITPQTSPVQPEKFSGYHTGVDVEYGDVEIDVPVRAIADGTVVRSGRVSGYGGMVAIKHNIYSQDYIVIYGHLDPDSLPDTNQSVLAGETIGILGKGYSSQTDGERKHLHFAIYTGSDINVRGYVSGKAELSKWLNPVDFLK